MLFLPPINDSKPNSASPVKDQHLRSCISSAAVAYRYDDEQILNSKPTATHRLPLLQHHSLRPRRYPKLTRNLKEINRRYFRNHDEIKSPGRHINFDLNEQQPFSRNKLERSKTDIRINIVSPDICSTPTPTPPQSSSDDDNLLTLLKRLVLDSNLEADKLAHYPNKPRFFSKLSTEGQSALLKTYEDTIANELKYILPQLVSESVPRIKTSKFRMHQLKSASNEDFTRNLSPNAKKAVRIESFLKVPLSSNLKSDPVRYKEHQLTVSQQLEIAQQILDLLSKLKNNQVSSSNTKEIVEILKAYVAYVKIWTGYFRLD